MNRRSFFGSMLTGGVAVLGALALLGNRNPLAYAGKLVKGETLHTYNPNTVTVDSWHKYDGVSIKYTFVKGPGYTTAEDAYEDMLAQMNSDDYVAPISDKVALQSVVFNKKRA